MKAGNLREITPADRLYHELGKLRLRLDQLLSEYEASTFDATEEPPKPGSFRDQLRKERLRWSNETKPQKAG